MSVPTRWNRTAFLTGQAVWVPLLSACRRVSFLPAGRGWGHRPAVCAASSCLCTRRVPAASSSLGFRVALTGLQISAVTVPASLLCACSRLNVRSSDPRQPQPPRPGGGRSARGATPGTSWEPRPRSLHHGVDGGDLISLWEAVCVLSLVLGCGALVDLRPLGLWGLCVRSRGGEGSLQS